MSLKHFPFWIGIISALFQIVGTNDCWIDAFNIDAIGKANTNELDFKIQLGIRSGTADFKVEMADNLR